jgi:hypothetical protein
MKYLVHWEPWKGMQVGDCSFTWEDEEKITEKEMLNKFILDTTANIRAIESDHSKKKASYLQVKSAAAAAGAAQPYIHSLGKLMASRGLPDNNITDEDDGFKLGGRKKNDKDPTRITANEKLNVQFLVHYKDLSHYHDEWLSWKNVEELPDGERLQGQFLKRRAMTGNANTGTSIADYQQFCTIDRCLYYQAAMSFQGIMMMVKWKELPWTECTLEPVALLETMEGYAHAKRQFDRSITFPAEREPRDGEGDDILAGFAEEMVPRHINFSPGAKQLEALEWMMRRYRVEKPFILNSDGDAHTEKEGALFVASVVMETVKDAPVLVMVNSKAEGRLWAEELHKVTPDLNVIEYTGSKDDKKAIKSCAMHLITHDKSACLKFDVIIVPFVSFKASEEGAYEVQFFQKIPWCSVILDEGAPKFPAKQAGGSKAKATSDRNSIRTKSLRVELSKTHFWSQIVARSKHVVYMARESVTFNRSSGTPEGERMKDIFHCMQRKEKQGGDFKPNEEQFQAMLLNKRGVGGLKWINAEAADAAEAAADEVKTQKAGKKPTVSALAIGGRRGGNAYVTAAAAKEEESKQSEDASGAGPARMSVDGTVSDEEESELLEVVDEGGEAGAARANRNAKLATIKCTECDEYVAANGKWCDDHAVGSFFGSHVVTPAASDNEDAGEEDAEDDVEAQPLNSFFALFDANA